MATSPLTTIAKVKEYLRIEDGKSDDLLAQLILSVSADSVTQTGRELARGTRSETRDGNGRSRVFLRQYPIASVSSLTVCGTPVLARSAENPSGYVITDAAAGELSLVGGVFPRGIANLEVSYVAGYDPIPEDLEQAVIELVALRFVDRDHPGISYKVMEGQVTDFRGGSQLAYARAVLERYRRPTDLG